ncbi:hypothetical protein EYF80_000236 [Liparis tanakae]|uniref:Uncharacterized protein n=1 Tax=Liparis tanakae TaxID=230148 RepID=A0A4Z2JIJ5_9TELE|nr:hypothetical protein EYF80_000236 [Liparis tanakae]
MSPVLALMILPSSSSSGVVKNVSESLLGNVGAELSAALTGAELSAAGDVPPFSVVGSNRENVVDIITGTRGVSGFSLRL